MATNNAIPLSGKENSLIFHEMNDSSHVPRLADREDGFSNS